MKKLGLSLIATLFFAGITFASPIENLQQDAAYAIINGGTSANSKFNTIRTNIDSLISSTTTASNSSVRLGYLSSEAMLPSIFPVAYIGINDSMNEIFSAINSRYYDNFVFGNINVWIAGSLSATDFKYENRNLDKNSGMSIIGADISLSDKFILGVGYSYEKSDINIKIADLSSNEMQAAGALNIPFANLIKKDISFDANMPFIYGKYNDALFHVDFAMSYLVQNHNEKKNITGENVISNYDVTGLGFQVVMGYDIQLSTSNIFLTPEIGAKYLNVKQDAFSDSLDSKVEECGQNVLSGLLGLRLKAKFNKEKIAVIPSMKFGVGYDIYNSYDQQDVYLANGSKISFDLLEPASLDFNVGVGIMIILHENLTLALNLNATSKQEYQHKECLLTVNYSFK